MLTLKIVSWGFTISATSWRIGSIARQRAQPYDMNSTTIGPSPWMTKEVKVSLVTVRISSGRGPPCADLRAKTPMCAPRGCSWVRGYLASGLFADLPATREPALIDRVRRGRKIASTKLAAESARNAMKTATEIVPAVDGGPPNPTAPAMTAIKTNTIV